MIDVDLITFPACYGGDAPYDDPHASLLGVPDFNSITIDMVKDAYRWEEHVHLEQTCARFINLLTLDNVFICGYSIAEWQGFESHSLIPEDMTLEELKARYPWAVTIN